MEKIKLVLLVKGGITLDIKYGILSILPPLIAIVLSFATKSVLPSLFAGILIGSIIIAGGIFPGIAYTLETLVENMTDPWNAKLLLFTSLSINII